MSAPTPKYGVVGLGIMGTPIARNLMKLGHPVVVWNRSQDKCAPLVAEGATAAATPADVVKQCDITFAMLSDPSAAEAVALGPGGVVEAISEGKGYVDMSTGALAASTTPLAARSACMFQPCRSSERVPHVSQLMPRRPSGSAQPSKPRAGASWRRRCLGASSRPLVRAW